VHVIRAEEPNGDTYDRTGDFRPLTR